MKITPLTITTICIMAFTAGARAGRLDVPDDYPTIQAAINAAANGDEIVCTDGTYSGPGNRDIVLDKTITVRSESGPQNCTIDCNATQTDRHTGFYIKSDATIVGLRIINGNTQAGGAILCSYESHPLIINCTISHNSARDYGGAIYCDGQSSPRIINCTISANSAQAGGALYCDNGAHATISNSIITTNVATADHRRLGGGGIYCAAGRISITNSRITSNSAIAGGGVHCRNGATLVVQNCTIDENTTEGSDCRGGAIYINDSASCSITNSNISANVAKAGRTSYGGGIYFAGDSSFAIDNCTINLNIAEADEASGGGIFYYGDRALSTLTITDTTVSDNKAQSTQKDSKETYGGGIYCAEGNLIIFKCGINRNSAAQGPGIYCEYANPIIAGCLITSNYTTNESRYGAGIRCNWSNAVISACTIVGNSRTGLYAQESNTLITNSILFYNGYDGHCPSQIEGCCPIVTYSDIQEPRDGQGNIQADPCFVQAGAAYRDDNGTPEDQDDDFWRWSDGNYHLLSTSPCINAGGGAYLLNNTDFDGNPRVIDGRIDMGAYEYVPLPPVEAEMTLTPHALSCASKGRWVKAHIVLPEGYLPEDIDVNTPAVALPMDVESEYIKVFASGKGTFTVEIRFDRQAFCEALTETGEVQITVTGSLTTGQYFYATDTIKMKPKPRQIIRKLLKNRLNKRHSGKR